MKRIKLYCIILISISLLCVFHNTNHSVAIDPFFTIKYISINDGIGPDIGLLLKTNLARIGIDLEIVVLDKEAFDVELYNKRDFSMFYLNSKDYVNNSADFLDLYSSEGIFGYDNSYDFDDNLGMGINNWYINQIKENKSLTMNERIKFFKEWQIYLMDKLCMSFPLFTSSRYVKHWNNLFGYNHSDGLVSSWGKMKWFGSHIGQESTDKIKVSMERWNSLSPFSSINSPEELAIEACYDPLFWIDSDRRVWPHITESFHYLNDYTLQIKIREGIKWDVDTNDIFHNEFLDSYDVYFSLFCYRYLFNHITDLSWLKNIEIIDDYTLTLTIDDDFLNPGYDFYPFALEDLGIYILPEHYLNQTQLEDGKTPDITHESWSNIEKEPIGTGLFRLEDNYFDQFLSFTLRNDSWWFNTSIINNSSLNWTSRFGHFKNNLTHLQIYSKDFIKSNDLDIDSGYIDMQFLNEQEYNSPMKYNSLIRTKQIICDDLYILGLNLDEDNYIGNREPSYCRDNLPISVYLRKALFYCINRQEINKILFGGNKYITAYPFITTNDIWCDTNIPTYFFDIEYARAYMCGAGFDSTICCFDGTFPDEGLSTNEKLAIILPIIPLVIILTSTIVSIVKKIRRKRMRNKKNDYNTRY